jgi:hypothetical protein
MRASAQMSTHFVANLPSYVQEELEMTVISRCTNAGPLGQLIRTRSFASLLARLLPRS